MYLFWQVGWFINRHGVVFGASYLLYFQGICVLLLWDTVANVHTKRYKSVLLVVEPCLQITEGREMK